VAAAGNPKSFTDQPGTGRAAACWKWSARLKDRPAAVSYQIAPRQPGGVAQCYADRSTPIEVTARRTLADMCLDAGAGRAATGRL
jgi:hypothetical protein